MWENGKAWWIASLSLAVAATIVAPTAVAAQEEIIDLPRPSLATPGASTDQLPTPSGSADCPLFYRARLCGHKNNQRRTMIDNRLSEPHWYRYYRCQHFGYYPTHWRAWPEGWLSCREPLPGPHPYDYRQPVPKNLPLDPSDSEMEPLPVDPQRDREPTLPDERDAQELPPRRMPRE